VSCSCRERGCGPPFCSIRNCAAAKGVDVCPSCAEYLCRRILALARGYPTLLADGRRLVEIGLFRVFARFRVFVVKNPT